MANRIEDVLREAEAAVDAAGVAQDLRPVAFGKIVDHLLSSKETKPSAASGDTSTDVWTQSADMPKITETSDTLERVATKLGVDRQLVEDTFHVDDADDVKLSLAPSQLDSMDQKAQQELALLIAAASQAGGLEEWTRSKQIRGVADDYGKLNHHFAENLNAMSDEFSFRGKGQSREVKLKKSGRESAAALIRRLPRRGLTPRLPIPGF